VTDTGDCAELCRRPKGASAKTDGGSCSPPELRAMCVALLVESMHCRSENFFEMSSENIAGCQPFLHTGPSSCFSSTFVSSSNVLASELAEKGRKSYSDEASGHSSPVTVMYHAAEDVENSTIAKSLGQGTSGGHHGHQPPKYPFTPQTCRLCPNGTFVYPTRSALRDHATVKHASWYIARGATVLS